MSFPIPEWASRKRFAKPVAAGERSVSHISIPSSSIANATRSSAPGCAELPRCVERADDRPVGDSCERRRRLRRLTVLRREDDHGAAAQSAPVDLVDHCTDLRVDVVERACQKRPGRHAVGEIAPCEPVRCRKLLRSRDALEVHPEDCRRSDSLRPAVVVAPDLVENGLNLVAVVLHRELVVGGPVVARPRGRRGAVDLGREEVLDAAARGAVAGSRRPDACPTRRCADPRCARLRRSCSPSGTGVDRPAYRSRDRQAVEPDRSARSRCPSAAGCCSAGRAALAQRRATADRDRPARSR